MKTRHLFAITLFATTLPALAQMRVARSTALLNAKNLTVTTTQGTTYYYLVSSNDVQTMYLAEGNVRIGQNEFEKKDIRSMRFKSLPRLLMDEDSLTYDKYATLDHGLLALRRHLTLNHWNSIVLPFDLTGQQVRDAFGEDAQLADIRGVGEDDHTAIEFKTLNLTTDAPVLIANNHYMLKPTKEPDLSESSSLSGFAASRVKGPFYLFPNVSLKAKQSARFQTIRSADEETQVRFRGTYMLMDGTTNKKVEPGVYTLDEETSDFVQHEDSVALKAFRSWVKDLSANPKPLKFYVDGVELTDNIEDVRIGNTDMSHQPDAIFDLSGRRVVGNTSAIARMKKGIYIINGKKVVIR